MAHRVVVPQSELDIPLKRRRGFAMLCLAAGGLLLARPARTSTLRGPAKGSQPGARAQPVGSKDFRPSGSGQPLPPPAIVDGRPVGLWWYPYVSTFGYGGGSAGIAVEVFLPDGTHTTLFRPGGPHTVDLDGMRAAGEQESIDHFSVSGGVMTITWAAKSARPTSLPIRVKAFAGSQIFEWSDRQYQPALPLQRDELIGSWTNGSAGDITWRADGSISAARHFFDDRRGSGTGTVEGRWALEGYLLALHFPELGFRFLTAFRPLAGGLAFMGYFWNRK